ncbi:hypothetical protein CEUSTIGMA_g5867.t1 [Chlamydomonas eustigma]|uniref:Uncharacterized protein n=1 Tax=Chlamydomonas eustigma TaxID=1157962 RepID=A0A250X5W1_9CHLO|nr:hypothetical protein CEUSTIGMA_g5867.t1 [Chlamydomonas eustigma]|eukprot:GAX78426.1 hypothetical protein CEUSTIGMA_g5867.t1 [Chlamydomonas eustigma]
MQDSLDEQINLDDMLTDDLLFEIGMHSFQEGEDGLDNMSLSGLFAVPSEGDFSMSSFDISSIPLPPEVDLSDDNWIFAGLDEVASINEASNKVLGNVPSADGCAAGSCGRPSLPLSSLTAQSAILLHSSESTEEKSRHRPVLQAAMLDRSASLSLPLQETSTAYDAALCTFLASDHHPRVMAYTAACTCTAAGSAEVCNATGLQEPSVFPPHHGSPDSAAFMTDHDSQTSHQTPLSAHIPQLECNITRGSSQNKTGMKGLAGSGAASLLPCGSEQGSNPTVPQNYAGMKLHPHFMTDLRLRCLLQSGAGEEEQGAGPAIRSSSSHPQTQQAAAQPCSEQPAEALFLIFGMELARVLKERRQRGLKASYQALYFHQEDRLPRRRGSNGSKGYESINKNCSVESPKSSILNITHPVQNAKVPCMPASMTARLLDRSARNAASYLMKKTSSSLNKGFEVDILKLEIEFEQKLRLSRRLLEENEGLVSKERILKMEAGGGDWIIQCSNSQGLSSHVVEMIEEYQNPILKIKTRSSLTKDSSEFTLKNFMLVWQNLYHQLSLWISEEGPANTSESILKRLTIISKRILNWITTISFNRTEVICEAYVYNLDSGQPLERSAQFWVEVALKLHLSNEQYKHFQDAWNIHSASMQAGAVKQAELQLQISSVLEEGWMQLLRVSSALPKDDKGLYIDPDDLLQKYDAQYRQLNSLDYLVCGLVAEILSPWQLCACVVYAYPSFPSMKGLLKAAAVINKARIMRSSSGAKHQQKIISTRSAPS